MQPVAPSGNLLALQREGRAMRLAISLLLSLLAGTASAQVFKCVDSAGKVSYQDRTCSGDQKEAPRNPNGGGFVASKPGAGPTWQDNVGGVLEQRETERARARAEQRAAFEDGDKRLADSRVPIDPELQRKCELERRSIDRGRRGTPSCDQLDRMYGIQKPAKIFIHGDTVHRGPVTKFDQYGNPYTDFGNGAPLIDHRTGRPCTNLGGGNISCD
ncbi:DUF4124 domain-containing protein [Sinimarinibacterium flocculans]|nr:DUF4124 domain-containing protein [Sinimarinibacterium flocculans]